jgi:hypothetical protein
MQVAGIRAEDIVECDVRGQKFYALVEKPVHTDTKIRRRVLTVKPISPGVSFFTVTPTQVTNLWRKKRARKGSK